MIYIVIDFITSNMLDTKWVYDIKLDSTGKVIQYRTKKIQRGIILKYELNYYETFYQQA